MRINTENLTLSSTDMTATITSDAIWLGHIANGAIQLVFTGSPNGTFKLQSSVDAPNPGNPKSTVITNWTDVINSTQSIVGAGDHVYELQNIGYTFVRVVWSDVSSGASTVTSARYMVKGV